ncbi:Pentatricopeptide repeat [Melia azedarach]|uniref:Pentatricopeptide repeat n=1 Tax=Melia azedarach TaxID=155640 RepID=A0ACC1XUK4_MELAZ|nr:Pentatricopeptide repeat [Melia azedarach]
MIKSNAKSYSWITIINSFYKDGLHKEAVSLFAHNIQSSPSVRHNSQIFAASLKSCTSLSATILGKALHSYVIKLGHSSCEAVSKALFHLYAKSGGADDCKKLFSQMDTTDPVVWNILLSGFASCRVNDGHVMSLFYNMHVANQTKPNSVTVAIVLPVCARLGDMSAGKSVHGYVIKSGLQTYTLVGNALISVYAKCGLVHNAYSVFDTIEDKDVVSWNAIISGFSENKFHGDALRLFSWMLRGPIKPNYATIVNILPICGSLDETVGYFFGRETHCYVLRRAELMTDVSVYNALVSFYLRVGLMEKAELLFQRMNLRDLVSWNAIIAGYASNDEWLKALNLFGELISIEMIRPDSVTLVSVLPACAQLKELEVGKEIHGYFLRHPYLCEDVAVGNALVSFYVKCNDIEAAHKTFLMISRKDLISWNSMLDAFSESGYDTRFLNLLNCMLIEGIRPNFITILTILHFCTHVLRVRMVKETHGYSIKAGLLLADTESNIGNAIIDAYAKCGNMEYAFKIFQSILDKRTLVMLDSMFSGYANCGSHDKAYMMLNKMHLMDLTPWNLMIRAYADNDFPNHALSLFLELQARGMKPDSVTIMSLLPVCSQMASVHLLRQCHGYVIRACFDDVHLKGALLDLYAKCGSIVSASKIFRSNPQKDLVMFTAMVAGYAMHGMGKEALKTFSHMLELGVKPDHVVITAALSACSHAGLVDEGLKIFYSIETVHRIKPTLEQYACLVDLLARGGRISDAYSLVTSMPIEANASIWGTLLGACRTHREVELGRIVANHLFETEINNIGNYVVMSNLYAADARWDGVMEIRKLMKTRELKKSAGCSWIEVERRKNVFMVGDYSHPQRHMIYYILRILDEQIKDPFSFSLYQHLDM